MAGSGQPISPQHARPTLIDLHCHILPGIDDGAPTLGVSLAMLDAAAMMGVRTIVATPHLPASLDAEYRDAVAAAMALVAPEARKRGIDLIQGYEVRLTPDVPARLVDGEPGTLAESKSVLVDLPIGDTWPWFVDETLFAIQTAGFQPILAHPERYPSIQREPELGCRLTERGVLLQVTAGSFSGAFGRRAKRTAERLLLVGVVDLVATDAHSAGQRMLAVPDGLRRIRSLVGAQELQRVTIDAPAAVLAGARMPSATPSDPSPWWDRLTELLPPVLRGRSTPHI